jgi:RNA polymerase sigma-70 factor, ECF subfamily
MEQLFRESRDDVYYYLVTFGLGAGEAQELAQEAFLRLYMTLRDGVSIQNGRAWLFRVAHNLALKEIERTRTRKLSAPELQIVTRAQEESPEKQLIRNQQTAKLNEVVGSLSAQQRLCLHLRAEGLRYAEIAETIGVSTSTVGEFLARAIKKLKKAINE